jgi:hypothetical protein
MALRNVHAFGSVFDVEIARAGQQQLTVQIIQIDKPKQSYTIDSGATVAVKL